MHDSPAVLPEQDLPRIPVAVDAAVDVNGTDETDRMDSGIVVTVQEADIEAAARVAEATPEERPCSLLVSGDSPLFCESLARLLGTSPDMTAAHAPFDHVAEAEIGSVTVLLLNVHAYRRQIVQVVTSARKRWPGLRVLLLVKGPASWCDRLAAETVAHGWLTRNVRAENLMKAVVLAHRDIRIAPDRMNGTAGHKRTAEGLLLEQLTDRETEVLRLLSTGQRGDAIARLLNISPNTVRTHIQNLIVKLGVHTRLEAVAFARRNGLLATASAEGDGQAGPLGPGGSTSTATFSED
jgi:DNA-binding NarL/FixJ family response regulator